MTSRRIVAQLIYYVLKYSDSRIDEIVQKMTKFQKSLFRYILLSSSLMI